jgi:hypothetical protein
MSKAPKSIKTGNAAPRSKTEPDVDASIGDGGDDVFDLPVVDEDIILTGAAADATDQGLASHYAGCVPHQPTEPRHPRSSGRRH